MLIFSSWKYMTASTDLETVDIGIGTDYDLVPAKLIDIEGCKLFVRL